MTSTCTNCEARPNPGDTQCQTCLVTIAMTSTVRTALNVFLQDHPNPSAVIEPLRKAVRAIAEMGMAGYPANADKRA